ncbi:MAG TPA: glycosyltransferase family 2 protein [Polyangiaceae bacterium]|nr:glycosyltransferase family 2 protein [Polyangiaceae bacterium]
MAPAISVLMPAFNAASTIDSALRSVQRQSEADWECLVVDDGSTDCTRQIAAEFARREPRVRLLEREHGGIVAALQTGLLKCRAPLIARFDADDLMSRRRLELQRIALAERPELTAVGCHVRLFPRASLRERRLGYERWLRSVTLPEHVEREAFVECPVAHPTLMIRRDALREFGYRDCGWPEDYDLVLRILQSGRRIGVVAQRLLHWRDGGSRLSRTSHNYSIPAFVECKAQFLTMGFLATSDRYLLWGFGDTGKALSNALARRGKYPEAIIELHPGRIGQLIRGVPVVAPCALPGLSPRPLIVSVAGAGPRGEIRQALGEMGFRELRDFVCAA